MKRTTEHNAKISASMMEKFGRAGSRVHCVEMGEVYPSIDEAVSYFKCTRRSLLKALRTGLRLYGFTFEWTN